MINVIVLLVACGFAAAIAYKIGLVHGINAARVASVAIQSKNLILPLSDYYNEPLPEGFSPRKDGGKELDDPVPLVQVEPSYYEYDETGESTGKPREEFRLGD